MTICRLDSFADGVALAADGATAFVEVRDQEVRTDYNVIAELTGDNVVMAGAHLGGRTLVGRATRRRAPRRHSASGDSTCAMTSAAV